MKIGDKLRYTGYPYGWITVDKVYAIEGVSSFGAAWVHDDDGDDFFVENGDFEPVDDSELAELRAFKAAALARFPELAKPETRGAAIDRLFEDWEMDRNGIESVRDVIGVAIDWGRANPA